MGTVLVNDSSLTAIANAIREKNGETTTYKPNEMATAISNIETGGAVTYPDIYTDCGYTNGNHVHMIYDVSNASTVSFKYTFESEGDAYLSLYGYFDTTLSIGTMNEWDVASATSRTTFCKTIDTSVENVEVTVDVSNKSTFILYIKESTNNENEDLGCLKIHDITIS